MKKYLLSIVCLMMIGMQSVKAQLAIAALHHEGHVSIYSASAIQDAIDAAVKGDTIYLSEGMFGGFNVAKPIAIIGAGQTTVISGEVSTGQKSSTVDSLGVGLLLSGLNIVQDLNFHNTQVGTRIEQCKIVGTCNLKSNYNSGSYNNIEIVMSQIKTLYLSDDVKGLSVIASKISSISNDGANEGSVTFMNCNINTAGNSSLDSKNSYVNCIINKIGYGAYYNCLYNSKTGSPVLNNCYQNTEFSLDDEQNCSLSDEELKAAGYVGTDNTWVGIYGGEVTYSLVMPVVQVTEHNIEVDSTERKLRVSLKLGNK